MKFKLLEEVAKFAELVDQQAGGIKILTASLLGEAPDMYWKHQNGLYMGLNNVTVETIRSFVNPSIVGMSDHNIYDPNVADQYRENDLFVMDSRKVIILEETYVSSNDESTNTLGLSVKLPLYDKDKKIVGVLGQSRPINKLRIVQNMQKIFSFPDQESFVDRIKFFMVFAMLSGGAKQEKFVCPPFSRRERDIAYYLLRGYPAVEMAKSLGLSIRTVETHMDNMKRKLHCSSKLQLVTKLFELCATVFDKKDIL